MSILEIATKRRSIRRYKALQIDATILKTIVHCGLQYPSRSNLQPLKFILVDEQENCKIIFDNILWGSKISQYKIFNNREYAPVAYIVILIDKSITSVGYEYEIGASIQNMLLCATEYNLGSLWIKSINKRNLNKYLNITENIEIDSIIALGYADQTSTAIKYNNSTKTIIDYDYNLLVPKRGEEDVLFYNKYGK